MEKKWIIVSAVVFIGFIVGMVFLAKDSANRPAGAGQYFLEYAQELGLDVEQFRADLERPELNDKVSDDLAEGTRLRAQSTPSLYFGEEPIQFSAYAEISQQVKSRIDAATETLPLPEGVQTKGAENPKVIISEFSDPQCPACARMAPILSSIVAEYPQDLAVVYYHFPLENIHPYARGAAIAMEAAGLQGKFWEMHDILFENQNSWGR